MPLPSPRTVAHDRLLVAAALVVTVLVGTHAASPASASTRAQNAEIAISPSSQSQPAGAPQTSTIAVSCFGTGGSECGPNVVVHVPLDPSTEPSMVDPSWSYAVTSPTDGLVVGKATVVGHSLVIHLDDQRFVAGFSSTLRLTVTPPNGVTPNGTSWSLRPTITGDGVAEATAPVPARSTATATPQVSISKSTADGGSVYEVDQPITFNLNARCTTASAGGLYPRSATIVDTLPPELTYVSSSPNGGVYDAGTNTVTWTIPDGDLAALPSGCRPEAAGPNLYSVTATAPSSVPALQPVKNVASFSATGPDATNPAGVTSSTSAQVVLNFVAFPPTGPGLGYATIAKTSLAPIPQPGIVTGNGYLATYPGDWVPAATAPAYQVGAAAASYQTTVSYPLVGVYRSTVVDPVPCLDRSVGNVYLSSDVADTPCAHPAFITQRFTVTSAGADPTVEGLGRAYASGWRPEVTLASGATVALTATKAVAPTASSATFAAPAGSSVATVVLPPDDALRTRSTTLTVFGYAAQILATEHGSLNELRNTATVVPEITAGEPLTPLTAEASVFTIPQLVSLGIAKQFSQPGAGPNGTTVLTLTGSVSTPAAPLAHDLVVADLLPRGLSWQNPVPSTPATLTQGAGASSRTVTASVTLLRDYLGSGRDLIRIRVSRSDVDSTGAWTVKFPTNFLLLSTPTALGLYRNTDQIFLHDLGIAQIADRCATPTQTGGGVTSATFESDNHLDLAGDGHLAEQYCQNSASLQITGTGAAFTLDKSVRGALDQIGKGPLGIGTTTPAGAGTFTVTWANVGSDTLHDVVVYDLLPRVGDHGVSLGQSTVARGSATGAELTGLNLPAGVVVAYSTARNPCRDEVFADAQNPTCVDDWSATPPSPLSATTAVRLTARGPYPRGAGFAADLLVALPAGAVNAVAWNSAATNAKDQTNPQTVTLAAEPPKVGLVAPSTPTIATTTENPSSLAHGHVTDEVTITGTGGAPGSLSWALLGPVEPVSNDCNLADFADAAVADHGTVPIAGDGTVTVGPATVGTGGCYSWAYVLHGTDFPYEGSLDAGGTGEQTTVTPYPPRVTTTASTSIAGDGSWSLADSIVVDSIPAGDPTPPTPLTWTLLGPVPSRSGSCTDLDWTGAQTVATGALPVDAPGNGTSTTPSTTVTTPGCYSFATSLPATSSSLSVDAAAGAPSETVLVLAPTITTEASTAAATPGSAVTDAVTIAGTHGGTGTMHWSLVGPVAPGVSGCSHLGWTGAPVAASGTVAIVGDGTVETGPATVGSPGCYAFVDELDAMATPGFPSPAVVVAGAPSEVIEVVRHVAHLSTDADLTGSGASTTVRDIVHVRGLGATGTAILRWTLLGPVTAPAGGCSAVDWTGAPVAATGTVEVRGDGVTTTPETPIPAIGCYTFDEDLRSTSTTTAALTHPGATAETVERRGGSLPFTGGDPRGPLTLGVTLLGLGGLGLALARRRRIA